MRTIHLMSVMMALIMVVQMIVVMIMIMTVRMAGPMPMTAAARLTHQIIPTEQNEDAARKEWEHVAGQVAGFDTEPHHKDTKHGRKKDMTQPGQGRDGEGFTAPPMLSAPGEYEGQPMARYGGMEESDTKAGRDDG
jgi:hypothetical protein